MKYIKKGHASRCCLVTIGDRFGSLVVVKELDRRFASGRNRRRFLCKCDCGKDTEVMLMALRRGTTRRCKNCPLFIHPNNKLRSKPELVIDARRASRRHYYNHLQQERVRVKSYKQANKERCRHHEKTRLSRLKNAQIVATHTFDEWCLLKIIYNYTCPCCLKSEPEIKLTKDHIIPLSKGGSDSIENIQPLCFSCNASKQDKVIQFLFPYDTTRSKSIS